MNESPSFSSASEAKMFARPEDLLRLEGMGGRPFEEFVLDLVREEGFRHGVAPHLIHWDHRTNLPDGGRDIVAEGQNIDPILFAILARPTIDYGPSSPARTGLQPATHVDELVATNM